MCYAVTLTFKKVIRKQYITTNCWFINHEKFLWLREYFEAGKRSSSFGVLLETPWTSRWRHPYFHWRHPDFNFRLYNFVGDPQVLVGDRHIFIGDPQIFIGDPRFLLDTPDFRWRPSLFFKSGGLKLNLLVSNEKSMLVSNERGLQ